MADVNRSVALRTVATTVETIVKSIFIYPHARKKKEKLTNYMLLRNRELLLSHSEYHSQITNKYLNIKV